MEEEVKDIKQDIKQEEQKVQDNAVGAEEAKPDQRNLRRERIGIVISNKMEKSIVIAVKHKEKHPIYKKFVNKTSKFVAHDEKNDCNIGDTVKIMETRPLSKRKNWRLVEILERAK